MRKSSGPVPLTPVFPLSRSRLPSAFSARRGFRKYEPPIPTVPPVFAASLRPPSGIVAPPSTSNDQKIGEYRTNCASAFAGRSARSAAAARTNPNFLYPNIIAYLLAFP